MAFDDTTTPPGDATTAVGGLYVNQMITARALLEGHQKMLHTATFSPTRRRAASSCTGPIRIGSVKGSASSSTKAGSTTST